MSSLPTADPYLPDHGDPSWSARRYDLALDYAVETNRLSGRATIEATAVVDVERVVLDLAHLEATKVRVDGRAPRRTAQRGHRLVITLAAPLAAGTDFTVVVTYAGRPRPLMDRHHEDAGWEELTDGVIVAGQPHGAPTWFPCNDRPNDKAAYVIAVTTQPAYTVVANGRLRERRRHGSSVTWRYEQPAPMATYLATVQIGRYEAREQSRAEVPLSTFAPAGADVAAAFGRQPEMMACFEERFGPYPFETYAAVVTDDDLEIPLESQGLSTFGRNFLAGGWEAVRLVAHELAHQWFGNAVTLRRWRDIWLHEGFACYAEWLWSEASGGEPAEHWARHHHDRLAGLAQDLVLADPGPAEMFDDRVYKRGALTLHALRCTVGDEAFFALLRSWVAGHTGGSVETADFVAHVEAACGDEPARLVERWVHQAPLPALPT